MAQSNSSNCLTSLIMWTMASHVKWFNIGAEYTLFLLMSYLRDEWKLGFAHAAGIINTWVGFSKVLSLFGAFMVDRIGNYRILLYSSIVYSIGFALLYMSTPAPLENMAGNCSEEGKSKCYGPAQKAGFYISLVLTGVGMAGHTVSLDPFLDEHGVNEEKDKGFWTVKNLGNKLMRAVFSGVSTWLQLKKWSVRFGSVAIYGFAATISLAIANWFNNDDDVKTKRRKSGDEDDKEKIDFRKMFKETAIVWLSFIICGVVCSMENTFFVEQANRMDRSADELEASMEPSPVELALPERMEVQGGGEDNWEGKGDYSTIDDTPPIPLGVPLLLAKAPFIILEHFYGFSYTLMKHFFRMCDKMTRKHCKRVDADKLGLDKMAALLGIGIAMINAVLCCLAAAWVENARRREKMKNPNSILLLVPQFAFITGVEAFLLESVNDFFHNYAPFYASDEGKAKAKAVEEGEEEEDESMQKKYIIQFTNFVMGLGFIGGLVSVLAVAKVSRKSEGADSWLETQEDEGSDGSWLESKKREGNDRWLENYYWILAVLSSINIIYYIFAAFRYTCKLKKTRKIKNADADAPQQPNTA